ncbi:MAG: SDR family NAD(P)-dependent oxidoreductase, partial [Acidimicrobiales bacterium]|nr:SDR family NAD(P)-dependent oxidoreductase [Acidimicrobiales bacterium]
MGIVEGKVALVTGAGRGVGRGEALELAAQGAKVVVNDFGGGMTGEGQDATPAEEVVRIITERGGEAVANSGNVASWDDAEAMVRQAIDTFGALDIVVNNAGILRDNSIVKMTEDEFDSVIAVHLKGTFNVTHHACVYWQGESKAGRARRAAVVNTVSSAGLQGNRGQANYGAAKAG